MTTEEQNVAEIKKVIMDLPTEQITQCFNLAQEITKAVKANGAAGVLAIALVGAEIQLEVSKL